MVVVPPGWVVVVEVGVVAVGLDVVIGGLVVVAADPPQPANTKAPNNKITRGITSFFTRASSN